MNLDFLETNFYKVVRRVATERGVKAYLIGGFVRDLVLDRPSKDIDIVCEGSGIEFAKLVAKALDESIHVTYYKTFGTAAFKYESISYEFVGARKESYHRESRKPIVEDGTIEDDQQRRDFTINALAISLNDGDFGSLIDPFNGIEHIQNRMIKTPLDPDITFSDDPLRMFRAIRFASQLHYDIEEETYSAIYKNAHRISIISMERIHTELNKIIESEIPSKGFIMMFQTGLLKLIFPEFMPFTFIIFDTM